MEVFLQFLKTLPEFVEEGFGLALVEPLRQRDVDTVVRFVDFKKVHGFTPPPEKAYNLTGF